MYTDFISQVEKSIRHNWNRYALTDYGGVSHRYSDVARKVAKLHILFRQAGIEPGDRIALYGRNSSQWAMAFIASVTYGAVAVPILHEFHAGQAQNIIRHSQTRILFCDDRSWAELNPEEVPDVVGFFNIADYSLFLSRSEALTEARENLNAYYGKEFPRDFGPSDVNYRPQPDGEALALINYTSGTTGYSKGVELPYRSLWSNALTAQELDPETFVPGHCVVAILPSAHMYGLMFELIAGFLVGMHTYYLTRVPSPRIIFQAFGEVKPHIAICVPLVIEKILQQGIVPKLQRPAIRAGLHMPVVRARIMARIKEQLLAAFGGRINQLVMGGAAFNPELEKLLSETGFPYTIGYGTTETGPLITFEHAKTFRRGTCGRAASRMEIRIDSANPQLEVGEILVRGENLMLGYHNNPEATAAVIDQQGWYHTGDLGLFDPENHLIIKGRSKNMLLTPNGQNVYPEEVESLFSTMPLVSECVMVQRDHKFVMLVYPDYKSAEQQGLTRLAIENIMEQNRCNINERINRYEQLSGVEIREEEFEKTPKHNIKRFLYQ